LFSSKEAHGGHVKDDEQHDGCNSFIIHEKKPKVQHHDLMVNFISLPSSIKNKFFELVSFLKTQALRVTRSVLLYDTKGFDSRLVFHTLSVFKFKQNQ
jgi:hypothetical protein